MVSVSRAFAKDVRRSILHSMGRFWAIFGIVALGAGFFAGLCVTSPNMKNTADQYYDDTNMMDIRVLSSVGFSDDDVEAIAQTEGVAGVMPSHTADVLVKVDDEEYAFRLHGLPEDLSSQNPDYINRPQLVEGRMPETDDECVIDVGKVTLDQFAIGQTIKIEDDGTLEDTLQYREYKIVGLVTSSYYISFTMGSTEIGSGSLDRFMYIRDSSFAGDSYTDLYVKVEGAEELSCFEDAYWDKIDEVTENLEKLAPERVELRYQELIGNAEQELEDGRQQLSDGEEELEKQEEEFNTTKADAEKQLEDAREKLEDANLELLSGQQQIDSAKQQLQQGKQELSEKKAEANQQFRAARAQLDSAQEQLDQGQRQYDLLQAQYTAAKMGMTSLEPYLDSIDSGIAQMEEQIQKMEEIPNPSEEQKQALEALRAVLEALQNARNNYDDLSAAMPQLEAALTEADRQLTQGMQELQAGERQYEEQKEAAEEQFDEAQRQLDMAELQIMLSQQTLQQGQSEYNEGSETLQEEQENYETQIGEGQKQIDDAKAEIADKKTEIADAQKEIDEAKEEIGDPQWYVLDRNSNVGFVSFDNDSTRIASIATVFPLIFFLVAALVALTTMTRMVEEERVLIGTYKALGYSNGVIMSKYLIYAALASVSGSIVGIVVGFLALPTIIWHSYAIMYTVPEMILQLHWGYALGAGLASIGCTLAATYAACRSSLREEPASLMLPRAPKAGKRILLERIRPIWSHMSFSYKVTMRNLFRYKKRFFMTVIGIAGCTALLLTGFGIKDSVSDILHCQYDDLYQYNTVIDTDQEVAISDDVKDVLRDTSLVSDYMRAERKTLDISKDDKSISGYIFVPESAEKISSFIKFRERVGGKEVEFNDQSVILTEKLAKELGVDIGDTVTVKGKNDYDCTLTVTGITENYIYHFLYVSADMYEEIYGEQPAYNQILAKVADGQYQTVYDNLINDPSILTVGSTNDLSAAFDDMIVSLNNIIWVITFCAGMLAFIVLYNLTNINVTERQREIATIKVLGFFDREVNSYIYRETALLTLIGCAFGLVLGIFLHMFVIQTVEVDMVMFGRIISPLSFLYSALMTIGFSLIVNFVMYFKLKKIDMVESLKSVD